MAITPSPCSTLSELPIKTGELLFIDIFNKAISLNSSVPMISAINSLLSRNLTITSSASWTTWKFVIKNPSLSIRKPEPELVASLGCLLGSSNSGSGKPNSLKISLGNEPIELRFE